MSVAASHAWMLGCLYLSNPNDQLLTNQSFIPEVIDTDPLCWSTGFTLYQLCFWEVPWPDLLKPPLYCRHDNAGHVCVKYMAHRPV